MPPTPHSREDVLQALHSKFEGIQAVAAEVLGAWGDPESKAALKKWFLETMNRPLGWAIRSVGVRELARLVAPEDTDWILSLYFGARDGLVQHELVPLAAALPVVPAKEAVLAKATDQNPRVRHSALKILVRGSWGVPKELLRPFSRDSDPMIQKMLKAWGAA